MLETSIIIFREGLEAFLIVAIMVAYLMQTGKKHLIEPVFWGVGVAVLISITTGWHIAELAADPAMEGILAIVAGIFVASLTYVVMKNAKNIKGQITSKLEQQSEKGGFAAVAGIFAFTVIMIAREGMETAMMLGAISGTINFGNMIVAILLGLVGVGIIGYLWIKQSANINLKLFMQVTGVFLILFCIHLFVYGFHELTEAGAVPFIDNFYWHTLTEPLEPGEPVGQAITISMLAIPCLWILIGYIREKFFAQPVFSATKS